MNQSAVLMLACLAGPAIAQAVAPPAVKPPAKPIAARREGSNAPVDIDADRLEVQDRADRAVFVGNVRAVQADMTLTAQRVTVAYTRATGAGVSGDPQINRIDASGGVTVRNPTETATGHVAIYDLNRRLITMLGNVSLVRQGNRVNGGRLVLDLNTNKAVVDGSAVAAAGNGVSTGRGGRVSGRFTVNQQAQPN